MKRIITIIFAFCLLTFGVAAQEVPSIGPVFQQSFTAISTGNGFLNNMVACYNLDEFVGTTVVDSVNGHNGNNTGADIGITGIIGTCYDFESTQTDYLTLPDNDDFSFTDGSGNDISCSINLWINTESLSGSPTWNYMLQKGNSTVGNHEWQLLNYNNKLDFTLFSYNSLSSYIQASSTTNPFTLGSWVMITATYNGSESNTGIKLYANGSELTTTLGSGGTYLGMPNGTNILRVGASGNSSVASRWDGLIDQIIIWKNRVITSDEVYTIYTEQLPFYLFTAEIYILYDNLLERKYNIQSPLKIAS